MAKTPRVLIAGESWTTHSIHQKGFDSFTTTEYAEGVGWLRAALESGGWSKWTISRRMWRRATFRPRADALGGL